MKNKNLAVIAVITLILLVVTGCSLTKESNKIDCNYCANRVQEEYIFYRNGLPMCPECAYEILEQYTDSQYFKCRQCHEPFAGWRTASPLLCEYCEKKCETECERCGTIWPAWSSDNDFVLCDYCLSKVFDSEWKQDLILDRDN